MRARTRCFPLSAIFFFATGLIAISCGKNIDPSGGRGPDPASLENRSVRPGSSYTSGWFDAPGPQKISGARTRIPSPSGFGILDVVIVGTELIGLDTAGHVFRVFRDSGGGEGSENSSNSAWKAEELSGESFFPPIVAMASDKDTLFLSREDGSVRAIALSGMSSDGAVPEIWSSLPGFPSDWLLVSATGHVVCVSAEGRISVLSSSDGSTISFLDLGTPPVGNPATAGAVFLVPRDKGLSAFELPTLRFLWTREASFVQGQPVWTFNGVAAFQDATESFRILDAVTGKERYSLPIRGNIQAACDGESLYLAGSDGSLGAYNWADGVPVWTAGAFFAPQGPSPDPTRFSSRLAAAQRRVYLAAPEGLEIWDSATGELLDKTALAGWADEISVSGDSLFVRARGGVLFLFGSAAEEYRGVDLEAAARPIPETSQRIASSLSKYSDPGTSGPSIAWRVYVPDAVPAKGPGYTVFRYDAEEAGNHTFSIESSNVEGFLMAVYDSNGEERHVNVGELGVDRSFEQWLEAGVWYVALGRLRGAQGTATAFLQIR